MFLFFNNSIIKIILIINVNKFETNEPDKIATGNKLIRKTFNLTSNELCGIEKLSLIYKFEDYYIRKQLYKIII